MTERSIRHYAGLDVRDRRMRFVIRFHGVVYAGLHTTIAGFWFSCSQPERVRWRCTGSHQVHEADVTAVNYSSDIIGGVASVVSVCSFIPQALKIIRTQDTRSISAGMYCLTVAGFTLWTAFGVLIWQWPVIAANSICLLMSAFILIMKLLPSHSKKAVAETLTANTE